MRYCTIITKRILKPNKYLNNDSYVRELHKGVMNFKGYINGESYWTNDFNIVTISKWDSYTDFNNWLHSDIRCNIEINYRDELLKEEHEHLYKIVENYGTFLL